MYAIISSLYRQKKLTAAQVWGYADSGRITEAQAVMICGPRPAGEGSVP